MQNRKDQRLIIGVLCVIIVGMVIGYASLNQLITINGISSIAGDFDIRITSITESSMTNATTISIGGIGTTTASFNVGLEKPGSNATYNITVENKRIIDAVLTNIEGIDEANETSPTDIIYSISGIQTGDILLSKELKDFQVKVEYKSTATSIPNTSKTLTLKLTYEQKEESGEEIPSASEYLLANVLSSDIAKPTNGLYAIDNKGGLTKGANPREYRYIGANPDNYVMFNNELWRIIGIFDGQLKIIKKDSLGEVAWDSNNVNDWSASGLQTYFNEGYLNSLDSISRSYISNYTWKLGGITDSNDLLAQSFYLAERGTEVYEGYRVEWTGKIGLMYPSDYGFATSGSKTNRKKCLSIGLYNWGSSSDCTNNDWLYDSFYKQWTLTSSAGSPDYAFYIDSSGDVSSNHVNTSQDVRPSLYLLSSVKIVSGSGKDNDPYILK